MIENINGRSCAGGSIGPGILYADPYLASPDDGQALSQVCNARIPLFDLVLLLCMWGIAAATSLFHLGRYPGYIFVFLNLIMAIRNPLMGLLVFVLLRYVPSGGLLLGHPSIVSFAILGFGCLVKGAIIYLPVSNRLVLTIIGFIGVASVSALFAGDIGTAWGRYNPFLEGLVLVVLTLMVVRTRDDLGVLLKWWIIVAALSAPLGVAHFIMGKHAALYDIVVLSKTREQLEAAMVIAAGGERSRLLWVGLEGNYHAASMIFPLAGALGLTVFSRRGLRKGFWAIATGAVMVAIVGTCSRSGMLACGCVFAMFFIQRNVRALIPVVIFGVLGMMALRFIPAAYERLLSVPTSIAEKGASGRFELYWATAKLAFSNPVFGNGIGAVMRNVGKAAHNTFLEVFAETGIFGLGFYVAIIVLPIRAARNGIRLCGGDRGDGALFRILLLGLFSMCLHLCTITLYWPQSLWFVCCFFVLFYEICQREQDEYELG